MPASVFVDRHKLRAAVHGHGLTARTLAEAAKCTRDEAVRAMYADGRATASTLARLAEVLGVDPAALKEKRDDVP